MPQNKILSAWAFFILSLRLSHSGGTLPFQCSYCYCDGEGSLCVVLAVFCFVEKFGLVLKIRVFANQPAGRVFNAESHIANIYFLV